MSNTVNTAEFGGEKAGDKFKDEKDATLKLTDPRSGEEYKPPKPKAGKKPKEKKGEE